MITKLLAILGTLGIASSCSTHAVATPCYDNPPQNEQSAAVCYFHAQLHQFCSSKELATELVIPRIYDVTGRTVFQPNNGAAITLGSAPHIFPPDIDGLRKTLEISWYPEVGRGPTKGKLVFSYGGGDCAWWSDEEKECASCRQGDWSIGSLDCATADVEAFRTTQLDCQFAC